MSNNRAANQTAFDDIIRELVTKRVFSQMEFDEALLFFCRTLSSALQVTRVGIWELNGVDDAINLLIQWDRHAGETQRGAVLTSKDARSYLDAVAMDYVLKIDDVSMDPRCKELRQQYLPKHNVSAMLDCPIRTFGGLAGIVCIEHVGGPRGWTNEEVNFAVAVTSLVSLTIEHAKRVASEKAAVENEDRLKVYTELATDWYWQTDQDFRFTAVEGLPARDGQLPEDYVGSKLWDVPILAPLEGTWEHLKARIKERKRIYDYVIRATDAEGNYYYAELAGVPRYDVDGLFTGYWGTAKDVSDRVRQNIKLSMMLSENESLLQQMNLVFETCGIGSYRYDGASRRLRYDQSFLTLYGLENDFSADPGQFTDSQVYPDDRPAMKAFIRNAMFSSDTDGSHLFRAYRADGQLHHMQTFWKLESEEIAGVKNIVGLHIDVTDVINAQKERSKALEHITVIAENVPGGIYESIWEDNAPRELIYISPKCAEMWGFSQAEIMADPYVLSSGKHPESFKAAADATRKAISTGETATTRLSLPALDGTDRWLDFRVQTANQGDGSHRVYGIFVDVTNEVMAQEEAKKQAALAHQAQKNESIGQLTGGVAHDFNNILAVILGNLELLRETIDNDAQKEMIDDGIAASQRGAELTRSLLAFARKTGLKPDILDLNKVARQTQNWMSRALPESIEVETSLLAGLWPVELDTALTESALLNLILNARDAMEGKGKLTIETANVRIDQPYLDARNEELLPGRYVMLAVTDTGSGIDADNIEKIFEPFFTTKAPGSGSGVGLSMVHGFVKQSGGTLQVYTEPGHGTSFKLYFPVSKNVSVPTESTKLPETRLRRGEARILLIEDDASVRAVLMSMLKRVDYEIVTAHSGDSALQKFHKDPAFDLVITDIVMPGKLQGTDFAKAVRETKPDLPFIFMSGYAAEATVHGNGLKPEDVRLMKPVSMTTLLETIANVLERASNR